MAVSYGTFRICVLRISHQPYRTNVSYFNLIFEANRTWVRCVFTTSLEPFLLHTSFVFTNYYYYYYGAFLLPILFTMRNITVRFYSLPLLPVKD